MKKTVSFLLSLLLLTGFAFADKPSFANAGEMLEYWQVNGYPDYVCGVWKNEGCITVAVKNTADDSAIFDELAAQLDDSEGLGVTKGTKYKYSLNELTKIKNEVASALEGRCNQDIYSVKIDELGNYVVVDLTNAEFLIDAAAEITKGYGDAVMIAVTDGLASPEDPQVFNPGYDTSRYDSLPDKVVEDVMTVRVEGDAHFNPAWLLLIFLVLAAGGYTVITRRSAAAQTTAGTVETRNVMSTKEVEEAIKNAAIEPPPELEEKIKSKIK